jgi:hypothetical protein
MPGKKCPAVFRDDSLYNLHLGWTAGHFFCGLLLLRTGDTEQINLSFARTAPLPSEGTNPSSPKYA